MVYRVPDAYRSRILSQVAIVALLAGTSAACTTERFGSSPMFTGATRGQQTAALVPTQPMPPALVPQDQAAGGYPQGRSSPITTADLPPPPRLDAPDAGRAPGESRWARPATPAAPAIPAEPLTRTAAAGQTIIVADGDTLYSLHRRYNVPVSRLATANGLAMDANLRTGQRLVIPGDGAAVAATAPALGAPPRDLGVIRETADGRTRTAATTPAAPGRPAAAAPSAGQDYTVKVGDTLYSIALANGVSPKTLADTNGMASTDTLRVGQILRMPGSARPRVTTVATIPVRPNDPRPGTERPVAQAPAAPAERPTQVARLTPTETNTATDAVEEAAPPRQQVAAAPANDAVADEASTNGTTFRWPVRGRIIAGFGPRPGGERNDGINLAVPEGTSVKAAEAGTVIYSGNEIAGYGNLVLIRHAGGWVTAYAHNSELMVKRGDTIRRGQIIAKAGKTGSVTAPQLHFELRRGSDPVNPLDYLSGA